MPHVSVVIPCFNQARYLKQAIDSALAQRRAPAEIIVVDDGSTDDTRRVAACFGPKVRYIYQLNGGLSAARNTGLRAAQYEYIGLLDADDLWLPDFIATLAPLLDNNPDWGAAYGGCQFVDVQGKRLPQTSVHVVPPKGARNALIDGDIFPAHAVLTRMAGFQQVGFFDESLRANEDWDMWLRLSAQYAIGSTAEIVALYRVHGNNMSHDLARMHESHLAVVRKHFGPAEGDPATWPSDRQRAYGGVYLWRALAHYQRGEPVAGGEYVAKALSTSPIMASRLETFYALGCADQPLGQMGDLAHLNLEQNAARLLESLDAAFGSREYRTRTYALRRLAYGTAYFALGLLAYGSGRLRLARRWLPQAALHRPELLANQQWLVTLTKSLLSTELLQSRKRRINDGSTGN